MFLLICDFFPGNVAISINVLEGVNATLDSGVDKLQKNHHIMWIKGQDFVGKPIAEWQNSVTFINESFKGVLQLNPYTGSLTIVRVTKTYGGFYCVKLLLGDQPHIRIKYSIKVFGRCFRSNVCVYLSCTLATRQIVLY